MDKTKEIHEHEWVFIEFDGGYFWFCLVCGKIR
jgi:hypothetical protein